jgi:hypothetical protein
MTKKHLVLALMILFAASGGSFAGGKQEGSKAAGPAETKKPVEMVVATFHSKKGTPSVDGLFKFREALRLLNG